MKKIVRVLSICVIQLTLSLGLSSTAVAAESGKVQVETIGVTTGSRYFSFWLDTPPTENRCSQKNKYSIKIDKPAAKEIMDIVKMAFLAGYRVNVQWTECTQGGQAGEPVYVKIYRE